MVKLCYRGIYYEKVMPILEASQKEIIGKYRGLPYYNTDSLRVSRHYSFKLQLKYRGLTYGLKRIA